MKDKFTGIYKDNADKFQTTPTGLMYFDVKVGDGNEAASGDTVEVHYTGTLLNGTKFDSSKDRNQAFMFTVDGGMVIKGWDEGLQGMKEGGTRLLVLPSELAYGKRGAGAVIPPDTPLCFEVELLKIR